MSSIPEQRPMSKRRLRGTTLYAARNYYSGAFLLVASFFSLPYIFSSNKYLNFGYRRERSETIDDYFKKKAFSASLGIGASPQEVALEHVHVATGTAVSSDLEKYDEILKENKPTIEDMYDGLPTDYLRNKELKKASAQK